MVLHCYKLRHNGNSASHFDVMLVYLVVCEQYVELCVGEFVQYIVVNI